VKPSAGELLPSVAAAVIGGISILGGRGTFTGTIRVRSS
jgi:ribose/xylose/arabinose/galactoside ABC-type transport system permease subunit